MIARELRFQGYNALRFVYRQGRVVRSSAAMVRLLANPRRKNYRLAIVVSKKISKSAVDRNRIRRRLFEAGRELLPPGLAYDIVVTVTSPSIMTVPKKTINNIFINILQIMDKPVEKSQKL